MHHMTIISDDIAIVFEKCFLNSKRSVKRLCVCLFVCVSETGSTAGRVVGAAG